MLHKVLHRQPLIMYPCITGSVICRIALVPDERKNGKLPYVYQALLQDSSARLRAAKEEAESKNAALIAELDKLRRAFTGDSLGWAAATDEQGKPYYYNSETGG